MVCFVTLGKKKYPNSFPYPLPAAHQAGKVSQEFHNVY